MILGNLTTEFTEVCTEGTEGLGEFLTAKALRRKGVAKAFVWDALRGLASRGGAKGLGKGFGG